jgi:hypothetical protein
MSFMSPSNPKDTVCCRLRALTSCCCIAFAAMVARWACVALLVGVASCADIRLGAQLNADIPELTLAAAQVHALRNASRATHPHVPSFVLRRAVDALAW